MAKTPTKTPAQQRAGAGEQRAQPPEIFSNEGGGAQARKLTEVQRLSELRPGTYWWRRLENPRGWYVIVSAFENNIKIRINAVTQRGLVPILNINYSRIADLIDILKRIDERLPQNLKQVQEQKRGGEW